MGRAVKKITKSVGKAFKGIGKGVGSVIGSITGATAMQKSAEKQQKEAAAQMAAQNQAMQTMETNFKQDLSAENVNTVIAGGSADLGIDGGELRKKRQGANALSSTLGINA